MKRYNIHLDPEWVKALDEITAEVQEEHIKMHRWGNITRADVIRVGIAMAFNLKQEYIHHNPETLTKIVKHVISKRKSRKGTHR